MYDLTQYDLPIPTGEKFGKTITAILLGLGFAGISYLLYTPVLGFLGGILTIGNLLLKIGAITLVGIVSLLVTKALAPGVMNLIAISGYKIMDFFVDNYPIEQMKLWRAFLAKSKDDTEESQRVLMGIYQENQNLIDEIVRNLDNVQEGLSSSTLTISEREDLTQQVADYLTEKDIYDHLASQLKEPIEVIQVFVEYKIKLLKAYDTTMRTTQVRNRAQEKIKIVNSVMAKVFGDSPEKQNAIQARETVIKNFGTQLGELKGFQDQMSKLIKAGQLGDKLAVAKARKYIDSRMNVIDGSATVIKSVPINTDSTKRNLLS